MASAIPISWTFNYQVAGGPSAFLSAPVINVDSCEMVTAVVAPGATGVVVDLQPNATKVLFLAITADQYDDTKITYKIDAGTTRTLDGPHIFLGGGAVGYVSTTVPGKLSVDNGLTTPLKLQVVVGGTT